MVTLIFLSGNLFQVHEKHLTVLEEKEKKLKEEIAKREKERESEPVSNCIHSSEKIYL